MTLVVNAAVGDPAANSFVLESEAIAFAATRLNLIGWVTLAGTTCTQTEVQALMESTREMSALLYQGYRASSTQALSWPRELAVNPDMTSSYYALYDDNVIPQRVKDATCELAFEFLKAGTTDIATLDSGLDVVERQVGPLRTRYAAPSQRAQGLARFPRVVRLISPLLAVGIGQARLVR